MFDSYLLEYYLLFFRDFLEDSEGQNLTVGDSWIQNPMYKSYIETLKLIAKDPDNFYKGIIAENLTQELAGRISMEDLAEYEPKIAEPISIKIGEDRILAPGAPFAGPQLLAFLNGMSEMYELNGIPDLDEIYLRNITQVSDIN